MRWEVQESINISKKGDTASSEDVIATGNIFAVVDGATPKTSHTYEIGDQKVSSGKFAAITIAQTLTTLQPDVGPFETVQLISTKLKEAVELQHHGLIVNEYPSASVPPMNQGIHGSLEK